MKWFREKEMLVTLDKELVKPGDVLFVSHNGIAKKVPSSLGPVKVTEVTAPLCSA